MALYKIRFSTVRYSVGDRRERAYRGETVDIPDESEADRLLAAGAIMAPDEDLDRPGQLLTLPVSPSDEELIAWVMAASDAEIAQLASSRPELRMRIEGAATHVTDARDYQLERLAEARQIAEGAETAGEGTTTPPEGAAGEQGESGGQSEAATAATPDYDTIVAQNADTVVAWVSENPTHAAQVLEAENRRAASRNDQPRVSVVRAVEAAAGHTG